MGDFLTKENLTALSDNTRVARPVLVERKKYIPKSGELLVTNSNGEKELIRTKNETINPDNRNAYQILLDKRRTLLLLNLYEEDKKQEEGMRNLYGFLTFTAPSTYIGPMFNSNNKSYIDNVLSGLGAGSTDKNMAIDLLTPLAIGGINKGVLAGNKFYKTYQLAKSINESSPKLRPIPLNVGQGPKLTIPASYTIPEIGSSSNQYFPKSSNPLKLHFQRLENGGYNKLESEFNDLILKNPKNMRFYKRFDDGTVCDIPFIKKDLRDKVSIRTPMNKDAELSEWDLEFIGGAAAFPSGGIVEFSPKVLIKNGFNDMSRTVSHELDHALHIPLEEPKGFDLSKLPEKRQLYFSDKMGTELSARGSQIKDWLGFNRADLNITELNLKDAAKNYIKETGFDNNMSEFFNSISDYKEAAEWLSKYATILSAPIILNRNE